MEWWKYTTQQNVFYHAAKMFLSRYGHGVRLVVNGSAGFRKDIYLLRVSWVTHVRHFVNVILRACVCMGEFDHLLDCVNLIHWEGDKMKGMKAQGRMCEHAHIYKRTYTSMPQNGQERSAQSSSCTGEISMILDTRYRNANEEISTGVYFKRTHQWAKPLPGET